MAFDIDQYLYIKVQKTWKIPSITTKENLSNGTHLLVKKII